MVQEQFDKKAFEQLFEALFEDLMAFVYSYVRDRDIARDIVHDAFYILWKNRAVIDVSNSPKSYLYKLGRNYALNYIRHQKVVADHESRMVSHTEEVEHDLSEYENKLSQLSAYVDELPPKQQTVLVKCFVEGKTYKEIAAELDISVNTVKTHLKRAIGYLREVFKEEVVLLFVLKKINKV